MKRQPPGTLAVVVSLLLAAAASAFWLLVPTVASVSDSGTATGPVGHPPPDFEVLSVRQSMTPEGDVIVRETGVEASGRKQVRQYRGPGPEVHRQTLLEQSTAEAQTIGMLALPVVLAALPLALNGTRLRTPARAVAAALLLLGSVLTGFSIGLYYLPSALAMTVAAILASATSSTAARQRP